MSHLYKRRVQFADTDAAGVVHFSLLLCYAEEAEHDCLQQLGIPLLENGGWPRARIECDYLAPVRLGEAVEITITPEKIGRSSVLWSFEMAVADHPVAKGMVKIVRVDADGMPVEIAPEWRGMLEN